MRSIIGNVLVDHFDDFNDEFQNFNHGISPKRLLAVFDVVEYAAIVSQPGSCLHP